MRDRTKLIILLVIVLLAAAAFVFVGAGGDWDYVVPRRMRKVLAMVFTGTAIAFSSVIFQTISFNRILTPGIMGFDAVYLFIQTVIVYAWGSGTLMMTNQRANFAFSTIGLMLFVALLYQVVLKRRGNVFFFMLVGVIMGALFRSLSTFMQMLIDPNEFAVVQDKMFASFNNIPYQLLTVSAVVIVLVVIISAPKLKYLDVVLLGRSHAVNLGVNYDKLAIFVMFIVTLMVAVSTALVGPITFMGVLVSNLAYELCRSYKHKVVITAAVLIAILALVGGQFLIERVFYFNTTISVIINFAGGIYFMYLLLRGNLNVKN